MSSLMRAYASRYLPRLTRSRYPWIFSFVPHALLQGGILSRYTGRMARQLPVGNRSWPFSCVGAGVIPANGTASQSGMCVPLVDMLILVSGRHRVQRQDMELLERGVKRRLVRDHRLD